MKCALSKGRRTREIHTCFLKYLVILWPLGTLASGTLAARLKICISSTFKHLAVFLYVHIYIILTLLDVHIYIYIGHMSIGNSCAT